MKGKKYMLTLIVVCSLLIIALIAYNKYGINVKDNVIYEMNNCYDKKYIKVEDFMNGNTLLMFKNVKFETDPYLLSNKMGTYPISIKKGFKTYNSTISFVDSLPPNYALKEKIEYNFGDQINVEDFFEKIDDPSGYKIEVENKLNWSNISPILITISDGLGNKKNETVNVIINTPLKDNKFIDKVEVEYLKKYPAIELLSKIKENDYMPKDTKYKIIEIEGRYVFIFYGDMLPANNTSGSRGVYIDANGLGIEYPYNELAANSILLTSFQEIRTVSTVEHELWHWIDNNIFNNKEVVTYKIDASNTSDNYISTIKEEIIANYFDPSLLYNSDIIKRFKSTYAHSPEENKVFDLEISNFFDDLFEVNKNTGKLNIRMNNNILSKEEMEWLLKIKNKEYKIIESN